MKIFVSALFMLPLAFANGQFLYQEDVTVPVKIQSAFLEAPWAGGLNSAQVNTMDLNHDGKDDLVIFDRSAQKVVTFLNEDNTYVHAPGYEIYFPGELANFLLVRDFNGDGKKDLFTGSVFGIRVFKNVSNGTDLLFEPVLFYSGASASEVLLTKGLSGKINLQLQFDDLPSIGDADGDGDIDIFCMDYGGSGRVEFHRNYSVERYGVPDSLDFELVTKSWGGFAECDCGEFAFNNEPCFPSGGRVKHQGGKSLLAIDVNGDGNLDMLISEAECDHISYLMNEGTLDNPVFSMFEEFPPSAPSFPYFPAPYYEDVDFDGVKDLVVSPNLFSKPDLSVNFAQSVWMYKNHGTDAAPDFEFQTNAFMQGSMIDLGDNAVPAFADLDADGDLDLFVSSNRFPSRITVFKNVGDNSGPSFELVDEDYLQLSARGFSNLKIQFIDIDNDGTIDLVFTANLNNTPRLHVIRNRSRTTLDFSGREPEQLSFTFSASENLHLTDINNDGQPDILRGRNTGALEYWRNTGGLSFTLQNAEYLGMGANAFRINPVASAADLNMDGKQDLIISDHTGRLKIVSDYKNASNISGAMEEILLNPVTETYYAPNLGGRVWPVAARLFNAGAPVIVAGTSMGGMRFIRPDIDHEAAVSIELYPNPVGRQEQLFVEVDRPVSFGVFDVRGRDVGKGTLNRPGKHVFEVDKLARGLYIVRFTSAKKTVTRRFVVY